jgi:oligopeptide/dipeptide ABC transporter ATP-binding protein
MSEPLLSVRDLKVHFQLPKPSLFGRRPVLHAVDGISFDVPRQRTVGIVGESGCGKSTTGLAILRLLDNVEGTVRFDGIDVLGLEAEELRQLRRRMQIVFQDPYSSLNPRQTAESTIRGPLNIQNVGCAVERDEQVREMFDLVGLQASQMPLFPHQFSGGQRQRISIAQALILKPDFVVCDEPVSALDLAIQAQILNLLCRLQDKLGLTYLFISHDLSVVHHICDSVIVMYLGKIVEKADRASLFKNPLHPYTRALLSAVPSRNPETKTMLKRVALQGDLPSPVDPANGCRFCSRCPMAQAKCADQDPPLREYAPEHWAACHLI